MSDLLRAATRTRRGTVVLPSEEVLVDEFRAARNTIRSALELLRADGLLDRRRGVGTVMAPGVPVHDPRRLEGPTYFATDGAERVVYATLVIGEVTSGRALAARLDVAPGTVLALLERLTILDGSVLAFRSAYTTIPVEALRAAADALDGDFWDLLEAAGGEPLSGSDTDVTVVRADASSAPHLDVEVGDLLVLVEALTLTAGGVPVALSFLRVRPDNFHLSFRSIRG